MNIKSDWESWRMQHHTLTATDGSPLAVVEAGDPNGPPVLFIHGWGQCHLSWALQMASAELADARLFALDLAGHGNSTPHREQKAYGDGRQWAEDVATVIGDFALDRPILVGSSYGGLVICDYLRHFGQEKLGGLLFSGAAIRISANEPYFGAAFKELVPRLLADPLADRLKALIVFLDLLTEKPLPRDTALQIAAYNHGVPPEVRAGLLGREADNSDVLAGSDLPTIFVHGNSDRIVLPAMSEMGASLMPQSCRILLDGVGHAPHLETPAAFEKALVELLNIRNTRQMS